MRPLNWPVLLWKAHTIPPYLMDMPATAADFLFIFLLYGFLSRIVELPPPHKVGEEELPPWRAGEFVLTGSDEPWILQVTRKSKRSNEKDRWATGDWYIKGPAGPVGQWSKDYGPEKVKECAIIGYINMPGGNMSKEDWQKCQDMFLTHSEEVKNEQNEQNDEHDGHDDHDEQEEQEEQEQHEDHEDHEQEEQEEQGEQEEHEEAPKDYQDSEEEDAKKQDEEAYQDSEEEAAKKQDEEDSEDSEEAATKKQVEEEAAKHKAAELKKQLKKKQKKEKEQKLLNEQVRLT